jgi:hypothetical protein
VPSAHLHHYGKQVGDHIIASAIQILRRVET